MTGQEKLSSRPCARTVWTARLYRENASMADDPVWECEHAHETAEEAGSCARTEAGRRRYRSQFAKSMFDADGLSKDTVAALNALDESFWVTERELDGMKETPGGAPLADSICVRLLNAYLQGSISCPPGHYPEGA